MSLWLFFYFCVLPWIAFLCVAAKRAGTSERWRTRAAALFAVSLALHAGLLLWTAVIGVVFAWVWAGGGVGRGLAFSAGLLVTCLGHVGVLVSLFRPGGSRLRLASVLALPAGWATAVTVAIVMVARSPS
jgi:hypothetical protein